MASRTGRTSRVVVITGASAGVGRATARAFAARGDAVGLIARGAAGLAAATTEITNAGGRAVWVAADVSDASALEAAADEIEAALGPIDVWVNNAMVTVLSRVSKMDSDDYRRVTEVTYLGVVHGTQTALKRMLPRNAGVIVQVGSALAYRGIPLQSAYCGAKHAIQGFNESLMNLWHAADMQRDFGAHGTFDAISRENSWQWLAVKNRKQIAAGVGILAALGYAVRSSRQQREQDRR